MKSSANAVTTGLRCSVRHVVEAAAKAIALRYGCSGDEADTLRCRTSRSTHPAFASLVAGDGREVRRFDSISDLDGFMRCPIEGTFFARAVRRACAC